MHRGRIEKNIRKQKSHREQTKIDTDTERANTRNTEKQRTKKTHRQKCKDEERTKTKR